MASTPQKGVTGDHVRLLGRNDTSLAAALIVGTLIVFQQPLRSLLDAAKEFEVQYRLELIPALVVLSVVFVFHQGRKRQEAKAEALAAAIEVQQARVRSNELERLVELGRALANAFDFTGLSRALWRFLPKFTQERAMWLLTHQHGCWEILLQDMDDRRTAEALENLATRALPVDVAQAPHAEGVVVDDVVCFPMMIGPNPVGIIQVANTPPIAPDDRRALSAAAALAAIAVRNVQMFLETRDNSVRDGLTGCFNRNYALETLGIELERARRNNRPLSLVLFDIDHFKAINDSHGHLCGDQLLAEVGHRLTQVLRTSDIKCRYGGDEFLVILPETAPAGAYHVADCLRREISTITAAPASAVTVSLGIATAAPDEANARSFIARADQALYRAKQAGRNRSCSAKPETGTTALRLVNVAQTP